MTNDDVKFEKSQQGKAPPTIAPQVPMISRSSRKVRKISSQQSRDWTTVC